MASDFDLLRAYAAAGDESAFAKLVAAHVDMVYSSALRQVRDPHLAEDVTQVAFTVLATKAASIAPGVPLAGWLFNTTRFAARNALRAARRRELREHEAAQMRHEQQQHNDGDDAADWEQLAPHLEEGLARLPRHERDAVLLRYFQGRTLRETGESLGVTEAAAAKRVSRALERLRGFFARRGVVVSSTGLAGAVSAHAVAPAPAGLAISAGAAALAGTAATAAHDVLRAMAWAKAKFLAAAAATVVVVAGGLAVQQSVKPAKPRPQPPAAIRPAPPELSAVAAAPPLGAGGPGRIAPGWPLALPGHVTGTPTPADLDGDGDLELLVPSIYSGPGQPGGANLVHPNPRLERLVFAFHHDGKPVAGWPVVITDHAKREEQVKAGGNANNWASHPSVMDWDGDGRDEVMILDLAGTIAIEHEPDAVRLRRISESGDGWGSAPLADLNADGRLDVVLGWVLASLDRPGAVSTRSSPSGVPGWPARRILKAGFAPAVADADGDGELELFHPSYVEDAAVTGYDRFGRVLPGWPQPVSGQCLAPPVLGDVDGDGRLDVVAIDQMGQLHLWTWDGQPSPAARAIGLCASVLKTDISSHAAPALADLDGDGADEIVVFDRRSRTLRAWRGDGRPALAPRGDDGSLPDGTIVALPDLDCRGGVTLADLGGDGVLDFFVGTYWVRLPKTGRAEAVNMIGQPARTTTQCTITDIDRDGKADVLFGLSDGRVFVYETGESYEQRSTHWPTPSGNVRRTGARVPPPMDRMPAKAASAVALCAVDAASGAAVAGVRFDAAAGDAETAVRADGGGRCTVPNPDGVPMSVWASAPGYATVRVDLSGQQSSAARDVALPKAVPIGGFVRDAEGQPVPGARVYVTARGVTAVGDRVDVRDLPCVTDSRGFWHCNAVPDRFDGLWLRVEREGYETARSRVARTPAALQRLREFQAAWVLLRDDSGGDDGLARQTKSEG